MKTNRLSEMFSLLGEDERPDWTVTGDQGATSTGTRNKPSKKTPTDSKKPPNVTKSGETGKAAATKTPANKPAKKEPMDAGIEPPNVTGTVGEARVYAGIEPRYGIRTGEISPKKERGSLLASFAKTEAVDEDPILKIAREAMYDGKRHHPFE